MVVRAADRHFSGGGKGAHRCCHDPKPSVTKTQLGKNMRPMRCVVHATCSWSIHHNISPVTPFRHDLLLQLAHARAGILRRDSHVITSLRMSRTPRSHHCFAELFVSRSSRSWLGGIEESPPALRDVAITATTQHPRSSWHVGPRGQATAQHERRKRTQWQMISTAMPRASLRASRWNPRPPRIRSVQRAQTTVPNISAKAT